MFTPIEKNSTFAAFHAAVNAGTPQDVEEVKAVVSTMLRLQAHYIRLQARAMEHAGRVLGVEVDPEKWAALACEDLNEKLGPVTAKLNEADGVDEDDEPYSFMDHHRFGAADYGVSERRTAA